VASEGTQMRLSYPIPGRSERSHPLRAALCRKSLLSLWLRWEIVFENAPSLHFVPAPGFVLIACPTRCYRYLYDMQVEGEFHRVEGHRLRPTCQSHNTRVINFGTPLRCARPPASTSFCTPPFCRVVHGWSGVDFYSIHRQQ
jgi:hypothetical protein